MKKFTFVAILIVLGNTVFTQEKKTDEFKPSVNVGGTIFSGWQFNMDSDFITNLDTNSPDASVPFGYKPTKNQFEISKNSFYFERAYVHVKANLTPQIYGQITSDIFPFTDGNSKTQFAYRVKNAFIEYTPLRQDNGLSLSFGLGIMSNLWIPQIEKAYGYRFIAKTLTDYDYTLSASKSGNTVNKTLGTYFSSADLGFAANFFFPKKFAEFHLAVISGNGYGNLGFDNRFKDIHISGFVYPLADQISKKIETAKKNGKDRIDGISELTFGGFVYLGKKDKGENYTPNSVQYVRNRFGGMMSLKLNFKKFGYFKIGGEYSLQANEDPASAKPDSLVKTNSSGLSVFFDFNPPVESLNDKIFIMARYDMFDPNTANDAPATPIGFTNNSDKQTLLIFGLFYKPAKVLSFGFSYHMISYQENFVVKYDGSTSKSMNRLYFNTILNF